ncbi:MAG: hypothetical protein WD356_05465 [Pseudomonadales bacterium]
MATQTLETNYHGATLRLEFEKSSGARLMINGLVRQERRAEENQALVLRLTSTVQTGYEWHEFIEGIVDYSQEKIQATLVANNTEIARESFERQ